MFPLLSARIPRGVLRLCVVAKPSPLKLQAPVPATVLMIPSHSVLRVPGNWRNRRYTRSRFDGRDAVLAKTKLSHRRPDRPYSGESRVPVTRERGDHAAAHLSNHVIIGIGYVNVVSRIDENTVRTVKAGEPFAGRRRLYIPRDLAALQTW